MKIIRNGNTYELTRQELFEAHEEYQYVLAKEVVVERLKANFEESMLTESIIEAAIETYLNDKDAGCEEDFCLDEMLDKAKAMMEGH